MGRKPKCTVEEKISAVEDYLNGIRSVSEIMVDLSIKSTRTIRNWILAYQNGGIEALCSVTANHSYSSEFKIEMVRKYINGEGSVTDLCARYGIPAHATLQKWISLYNANRELRDYDPNKGSSGLGLYIVKELLKKIDGKIENVSYEGNILSISICFPLYNDKKLL